MGYSIKKEIFINRGRRDTVYTLKKFGSLVPIAYFGTKREALARKKKLEKRWLWIAKLKLYNKYGTKLEAKKKATYMRTLKRWKHVQVKPIKKYGFRAWGIYTGNK